MKHQVPLKIYMITGETSGDLLGASILQTFKENEIAFEFGGLAGPKMQQLGVSSLFDNSQLSLMGLTAVIGKLPSLLKLVRRVAADIRQFEPDVILLIDSPDFNYAVAKRVKKTHPDIPIVKYICPSVWAWRQGRAKKITAFIDHVLAILPFEAALMKKLGGPPTTYVGHPLARELKAMGRKKRKAAAPRPKLLVLPGSRKGEVKRLLPVIGETLSIMAERQMKFDAFLPAVDRLAPFIRQEIAQWRVKPTLIVGSEGKKQAFESADLALACSGTVMLELALHKIPCISIYKLDRLGFIVRNMVDVWTACLPNLITDKVLIPELFEYYANPQLIARLLQDLASEGPARTGQLEGFELLWEKIGTDINANIAVTSKVLEIAGRQPLA